VLISTFSPGGVCEEMLCVVAVPVFSSGSTGGAGVGDVSSSCCGVVSDVVQEKQGDTNSATSDAQSSTETRSVVAILFVFILLL